MFYKKRSSEDNDNPNFYMSFTDFALTLLITFILLSTFVIVNLNQENDRFQKVLDKGFESFKVREIIAENLIEEFKDFPGVTIDKYTGKVTLDSNKTEFYPEQSILVNEQSTYNFINAFFPRYLKAIKKDSTYYEYVKSITIEGHTARSGDELRRMQLSLERAFTIYSYIYYNRYNYGIVDDFNKIQAVGRGSYELKDTANPEGANNRRVEFSFTLDEDKIMNAYKESIESELGK